MNGFEFCRLRAGLTQVEVAEAMGITQSTVSNWEQGYAFPTGSKIPALAQLYGCEINELFEGSGDGTRAVRMSKRKRMMLEYQRRMR